jgi:agmatinase
MAIVTPNNFLALPEELSSYTTAGAVVWPIPYDLTLTYRPGARLGPQAIIAASRQVETFDDDLQIDPSEIGIATLPELEQLAASPEAMQDVIYSECCRLIEDGKYVMTLGGEHSITAALVKAHKEKYPNLSVLHIDAHSDLRDSYQGSKYSHACVMARVAELTSFVSVGIRSFSGSDNERKYKANIFNPGQLRADPGKVKQAILNLTDDIYITIDLDGFDPSVIPAVGTPEPGGLLWHEVIDLLNETAAKKHIVGADVVELSPRPGLDYADFAAAKLTYKVITRSFFKG